MLVAVESVEPGNPVRVRLSSTAGRFGAAWDGRELAEVGGRYRVEPL